MIRAYKYRLYPTEQQKAYFARCFGATRYCYNYCVRQYDAACLEGRQLSGFDVAALLREHTKNVAWMADVDYEIKESAPLRFDNALGKYIRHEANRPREHKKGERAYVSYTTCGIVKIDHKHDLVQLPKIGVVSARIHRSFTGEIMSATVKLEPDKKYYICINVNSGEPAAPKRPHTTEGTVGVDVGLRHLATLSNGDHYEMPDMNDIIDRIAFLKKRQSLQQPGSRRYERTALQIARLHRHMVHITQDKHHKVASELCKKYDTICMETLNVDGMKQGEVGARTRGDDRFNYLLHHMALASFIDRIQKKAEVTGTNFVGIDRWEPTTKKCHVCGYVLDNIDLHTSAWTCPECGTHHDRDENAAINIRNKGIEQLQSQPTDCCTIDTLPMAVGNVKPAMEATGCDLRTGKLTVRSVRPPKVKIAIGTAPPRISTMYSYVSSTAVAKIAGTSAPLIDYWAANKKYFSPKPKQMPQMLKVVDAYRQIGQQLSTFSPRTKTVEDAKRFCQDARQLVQLSHVCDYVGIYTTDYRYIYSLFATPELNKLMEFMNVTLPIMIREECQQIEEAIEKASSESVEKPNYLDKYAELAAIKGSLRKAREDIKEATNKAKNIEQEAERRAAQIERRAEHRAELLVKLVKCKVRKIRLEARRTAKAIERESMQKAREAEQEIRYQKYLAEIEVKRQRELFEAEQEAERQRRAKEAEERKLQKAIETEETISKPKTAEQEKPKAEDEEKAKMVAYYHEKYERLKDYFLK